MCGILAILNIRGTQVEVRAKAYELSRRIRHRGPDRSRIVVLVYHSMIIGSWPKSLSCYIS